MNLGHRPIDPPLSAKRAPLSDEFVTSLFELFYIAIHNFQLILKTRERQAKLLRLANCTRRD